MVFFLRLISFLAAKLLGPFKKRRQTGGTINCLLVGYGGAANTGAEARTAGAIRQILSTDPRVQVTLTSLNRRQTLRYIEETDRLRVVEVNPVFILSILRLVFRSDLVVLVEGSCFKENFSSALLWLFLYSAELAQKFGLPTVTYGVDAGELKGANLRWARDVANKIDLLMVRTLAAKQILVSMGVINKIHVTTDTAFGIESMGTEWAEAVFKAQGLDAKSPILGIAFEEFFWWPVVPSIRRAILGQKTDRYKSIYYHSWGKDGKGKSREMKKALASYADWARDRCGANVVFFAMERLDIAPCNDVRALMKSKSLLIDSDHANASQIAALLRRLDWLVTCRYHALVLSLEGQVPVIGLSHDERIASIMDELGFIHDYFISHEDPNIFDELAEKTIALRRNSTQIRRTIANALPGYTARMKENSDLFRLLIKEKWGQSHP